MGSEMCIRDRAGAEEAVKRHLHAAAVDHAVVDFEEDRHQPLRQAVDHVQLPKRARTVETLLMKAADKLEQLGLRAWCRQSVAVAVFLDVDDRGRPQSREAPPPRGPVRPCPTGSFTQPTPPTNDP